MSSNWGSSSGSSSRSDVENSFDAEEELLQIGTRCREVNLIFLIYTVAESYCDLMFSLLFAATERKGDAERITVREC